MQTEKEQKNVPASKQVSDQWLAGIEALGELRKRAETNPDDSNEIKAHLAAIKAAHGFSQLTAKRQGDLWVVHAAMNPEGDFTVKAKKEGDANDTKTGADGKTGKKGNDREKSTGTKSEGKAPPPQNKYHATVTAGTTKKTYDVSGPWSTLHSLHPDYPSTSGLTKHPINSFEDGMETPLKPSGEYHLKKGNLSTGGSWAAVAWRTHLATMRDDKLQDLRLSNPQATEQDANNAMITRYKTEYPGISTWDDLNLTISKHNFEGHHVHPVNWNEKTSDSTSAFYERASMAISVDFSRKPRIAC